MAQDVKGQNSFIEQPQQDTYQIGEGRVTTRIWRGPRALYENKFSEVQGTQPDRMNGVKGTPAEIQATYLPDDPPTDDDAIWELIPSPIDRDLATHPAFNLTPSQIGWAEKIDKAIREGRASETDWDAKSGSENLNDYRDFGIKGVNSFRMWSYTVRKTITTSLAGVDKFTDTDAGIVVGWNDIPLPSDTKFDQPVWNRWDGTTLENIPINEWLTSPATIRYERRRYTIMKEWYGAIKWYALLYKGGTATADEDGSNLG